MSKFHFTDPKFQFTRYLSAPVGDVWNTVITICTSYHYDTQQILNFSDKP